MVKVRCGSAGGGQRQRLGWQAAARHSTGVRRPAAGRAWRARLCAHTRACCSTQRPACRRLPPAARRCCRCARPRWRASTWKPSGSCCARERRTCRWVEWGWGSAGSRLGCTWRPVCGGAPCRGGAPIACSLRHPLAHSPADPACARTPTHHPPAAGQEAGRRARGGGARRRPALHAAQRPAGGRHRHRQRRLRALAAAGGHDDPRRSGRRQRSHAQVGRQEGRVWRRPAAHGGPFVIGGRQRRCARCEQFTAGCRAATLAWRGPVSLGRSGRSHRPVLYSSVFPSSACWLPLYLFVRRRRSLCGPLYNT